MPGLRRRLEAAEDGLAEAQAVRKRAEGEFGAATDRVEAAERALEAAQADRNEARRARYAARQAHVRPPRRWTGSIAGPGPAEITEFERAARGY